MEHPRHLLDSVLRNESGYVLDDLAVPSCADSADFVWVADCECGISGILVSKCAYIFRPSVRIGLHLFPPTLKVG